MRKRAALVALAALGCSTLSASSEGLGAPARPVAPARKGERPGIRLYASPDGTGDGLSAASPGSLAAVKLLAAGARDNVTVYLAGGRYRLGRALSFTARDSPQSGFTTVWRPLPGEAPVLEGGIEVARWTLVDVASGIYSASVPPGTSARQFWVNGRRATRARWRGDTSAVHGTTSGSRWELRKRDAVFPAIGRPSDLEFVFQGADSSSVPSWTQPRLGVASLSDDGETATFTMNAAYAYAAKVPNLGWGSQPHPVRIENAYEFLAGSGPGSWYLNPATSTVYYIPRPGEDVARLDAWLGGAETLISVNGASHVTFQGITVQHAGWLTPTAQGHFFEVQANLYWNQGADPEPTAASPLRGGSPALRFPPAAIEVRGSVDVRIRNCTVRHCGGRGIYVGAGSSGCRVTSNAVYDASSTGIAVGDLSYPGDAQTTACEVTENTVTGCAAEFRGGIGIQVGVVSDSRVNHNSVARQPYTGISFGWGWSVAPSRAVNNEIGWNRIEAMRLLDDGGAIYTLGYQDPSGSSSIHDNYIHGRTAARGAAGGIYNDAGSCHWRIDNNVVVASEDYTYITTSTGEAGTEAFDNTGSGNWCYPAYVGMGQEQLVSFSVLPSPDGAGWPAAALSVRAAAGAPLVDALWVEGDGPP